MAAGEFENRFIDPRLVHVCQTLLKGVVSLDIVKAREASGLFDHNLSLARGAYGQIALGVVSAGHLGQKLFTECLVMEDALVKPVGICIDNHWWGPPFILSRTF